MITPMDLLLTVGASLRITRLATTDTAGRPLRDAVHRVFDSTVLDEGMECPFCVGFWITAATVASGALASRHAVAAEVWRTAAACFAASYVVGHLSARLD